MLAAAAAGRSVVYACVTSMGVFGKTRGGSVRLRVSRYLVVVSLLLRLLLVPVPRAAILGATCTA